MNENDLNCVAMLEYELHFECLLSYNESNDIFILNST